MSETPESRRKQLPYDRPNDRWICGDADRRNPCPLGPTQHGLCSGTADCQPRLKDGRWLCGRATCFGGPCAMGPTAEGVCGGLTRNCQPRARLRWTRARFVCAIVALTLGLVLLFSHTQRRDATISPGPLSANHAMLLDSHGAGQRCTACHASTVAGPSHWLSSVIRPVAKLSQGQSQLCLKCHQHQFSEDALHAHGVSPLTLAALTDDSATQTQLVSGETTDRAIHNQQFACATCHHEHEGDTFKSLTLSNTQCASCHQHAFDTFPAGHPEFENWPVSADHIRFPHELHRQKHFREADREYACRDCHASGTPAEIQAITGYAQCAACHDRTIRAGTGEGLKLISVPVIDFAELPVSARLPWPVQSQGPFDGPLAPWMQLLLAADTPTRQALSVLGPEFDFLDLETGDSRQSSAARIVVEQIAVLAQELARDARSTLRHRLSASLKCDVSADEIELLLQGLPDEFLQSTLSEWFASASRSTVVAPPVDAALLDSDDDSLLTKEDPALSLTRTRSDTTNEPWVPSGWQRDVLACALVYRPIGHADPVIRCLIELTNPQAGRSPVVNQVVQELRQTQLIQQCTVCHQPNAAGRVLWNAPDRESQRPFTRFEHGPHLTQAELRDCVRCHVPKPFQTTGGTTVPENPAAQVEHASDFCPLTKQHCATCHHDQAVGSRCMTCHNYHVSEAE